MPNPNPEPPHRALGLDYGEARIGVAATDALGMLAHPVETIDRKKTPQAMDRVRELAAHLGVGVVVVGLPVRMDGTEGTAAAKVRKFAAALRRVLPDEVAIDFVDERLSTVEAQRHLRAAGHKARDSRPIIDRAAAVVILQDWLDQRHGPQSLLLPDPWEEDEENRE